MLVALGILLTVVVILGIVILVNLFIFILVVLIRLILLVVMICITVLFMEKVDTFLIENCEGNASIVVYGDDYHRACNGEIRNCTIYNTTADAFVIHRDDNNNNTGNYFYIHNCTSYDYGENAIDLTAGNGVLVEDCTLYNSTVLDPAIQIGHDIENCTVQNCLIYNINGSGILIGDSSNSIIRNNTVWNTTDGSSLYFTTTDGSGWDYEDGYAENCTIYNNDFIYTSNFNFTGDIYTNRIMHFSYDYMFHNYIKNNVFACFYDTDYNPDRLYRTYGDVILPPSGDNVTFANNTWWHAIDDSSRGWFWNGSSTMTIAQWQNYYPGDTLDDPELANVENRDLTLNSTSPCVNNGSWLTQTSGTGTSTIWVTLDDASYFMDGYNWTDGDKIFVGTDTGLTIEQIYYHNNTIRVDSAISWADDEDVSLDWYLGSGIDIGCEEYNE